MGEAVREPVTLKEMIERVRDAEAMRDALDQLIMDAGETELASVPAETLMKIQWMLECYQELMERMEIV